MSKEDDTILVGFYEESRDHLDTIEDDLLTLENQRDDFDEELVNSIFRAVHTIKGGCGFLGLDKLGSLSHIMENLLDRIRQRDIEVTSHNVNILLKGADLLKIMVETPERTEELDIDSVVEGISNVLNNKEQPPETAETVETADETEVTEVTEAKATYDVKGSNGETIFTTTQQDVEAACKQEKGGQHVYLFEYDLLSDIEDKGKAPWDVISELLQLTSFIDSKVDFAAASESSIPFYILLTTVIETDLVYDIFDLDESKIHLITDTGKLPEQPTAQDAQAIHEEVEAEPAPVQEQPSVKEEKNEVSPPKPPEKKPEKAPKAPSKGTKKPESSKKAEGSLRINLGLLDRLMSLAGELVLARNELIQNTQTENLDAISNTSQRVDLITAELQEAIMATRMQSIGIVFNKFNRVVRDLSRDLGKEIELILEGKDVELDKTIIESIGDPLTHIVRNSLDHGIETPEKRIAAGKQSSGTLKISARHEGGHVVIEIEDDGQGVNIERVKAKALHNNLCTEEQLEKMSDKEAVMLIFKPGFSTAEEVTSVSGRGVGMDVVLTNLNKLGGSIDIDSTYGKGTNIRINLPLTLAIIPSLLVRTHNERYAIPQVNLVELVRIPAAERSNRLEHIGNALMMRLRDHLLPLIVLNDVIGVKQEGDDSKQILCGSHNLPDEDKPLNIAVLIAGDIQYGLIVDELLDSSEIVVKPLGRHFKSCRGYAGATILGDGNVALILDVVGIARDMELAIKTDGESPLDEAAVLKTSEDRKDKQALLLVHNAETEQFAIPLGLVIRIEKINSSSIELVGGRKAIKYRDGTLSLFALEEVANITPRKDAEKIFIVVFKIAGREVGLILSEVNDIVVNTAKVDSETYTQTGIFGSTIVNDKITLIIDIFGLVYSLMPHWRKEYEEGVDTQDYLTSKPTVLIAEDSRFFMNQLKGFMEEIGFDVLTAEDGEIALNLLKDNSDRINIVLTDIEMPNMDGLEFTRKAREDDRFGELPILAVTSVAGDEAEKRGIDAGLDEYLVKLNRDELIERTSYYLKHGRVANQ
jgi:two-component system chemotaxis sensor kinase CheA